MAIRLDRKIQESQPSSLFHPLLPPLRFRSFTVYLHLFLFLCGRFSKPFSSCSSASLPSFSGLSFKLFYAYRYVRHVQFYEGKRIRRADGRRLIKAWVCALGVLVSTTLGADDDVAVWTPMASSRRPTPTTTTTSSHSLQARSDTKWSFF